MRTEPLASTSGAPLPSKPNRTSTPNQRLRRMKPVCCKKPPMCKMEPMRWLWVLVLVGTAWADKKIVDMTPRYEKELAACEMQESGIGLMITRAKAYVASNP